jgi:hypothetical protein
VHLRIGQLARGASFVVRQNLDSHGSLLIVFIVIINIVGMT